MLEMQIFGKSCAADTLGKTDELANEPRSSKFDLNGQTNPIIITFRFNVFNFILVGQKYFWHPF